MKKILLLLTICAVYNTSLLAQTIYTGQDFILNKPITPDEEYEGNTEVTLVPGFEYIAATNIGFTAKIKGLNNTSGIPTTLCNYLSMPVDATSRNINTSFAVGSLIGVGNITQTGAFTYQIPISIPPGTSGMAPSLNIVYNSQGGKGLCGLGWNIAGLSAIGRAPATNYHDGFVDGVDFDACDNLTLDGQRLIDIGNNEFRTEVESFSKIQAWGKGSCGLSYCNFTVTTKDGYIMEYGNSSDSKLFVPSQWQGDVLSWALNKVTDPNGNYYTISYFNDAAKGEIYPDKISYTGNANEGLTTYNEIQFYYSFRSDPSIAYLEEGRGAVQQTVILDKIITRTEGNDVFDYNFRYTHDDLNTYLNEIQLCSGTDCYNSTAINYAGLAGIVTRQSVNGLYPEMAIDITGDGIPELIKKMDNGSGKYNQGIDYKELTGGNNGVLQNFHTSLVSYDDVLLIPGDFDGDGIKDIIPMLINVNNAAQYGIEWYETFLGGSIRSKALYDNSAIHSTPKYGVQIISASSVETNRSIHASTNFNAGYGMKFYTGDFEGIGQDDLLHVSIDYSTPSNSHLFLYKFSPYGNDIQISKVCTLQTYIDDKTKINIADFNGDGKSDIMIADINGTNYFTISNGNCISSGTSAFSTINSWKLGYPTSNYRIYTGDFNGDGKTDLLNYIGAPYNKWEKAIWNGNNGYELSDVVEMNSMGVSDPGNDNKNYDINCIDINGDGKTDIYFHSGLRILYKHYKHDSQYNVIAGSEFYSVNTSEWDGTTLYTGTFHHYDQYGNNLLLSDGKGNFIFKPDYIDYATTFTDKNNVTPFLGDFNGDGQMDNYNLVGGGHIRFYFKNDESRFVRYISDGKNDITKISYQKFTQNPHFIVLGNNVNLRCVGFPIPLANEVISHFSTTDAINTFGRFSFPYINANGKGFLGFKQITIGSYHYSTGNNYSETFNNYSFNSNYFYPELIESKVKIGTLNSHSTISSYTHNIGYGYISYGNKRFFPFLDHSETDDASQKTTYISNNYDNNGNQTYALVNKNNEYNILTTNTFTQAGSWLPNRILNSTTSTTNVSTGSSITHTADFTYDNLTGNLLTSINDQGQVGSMKSTNYYNGFGAVIQSKLESLASGATMPARNSFTFYDAKNRFVIKKQNAKQHQSTYTYDPAFGTVLTAIDINGHTITNTYDNFGTKTATTDAIGTTNYTLNWNTATNGTSATVLPPNTTASTSIYDQLGRSLEASSTNYGKLFKSENSYTPDGRLDKSSNVFAASGGTAIYTQNTYDPTFGYVTQQDYNNGTAITATNINVLNSTTTTTAPDGSVYEKTFNVMGQLISSKDPNCGGSACVFYEYDANGKPTKITNPSGVINMQYDHVGRQTQLTDPNAGSTQYAYNDFGELKSQTNAAGQTTTLTYDILGRPLTTSLPEGTITTTYDNKTNGKGMAGTITSNLAGFNNSINYTYDNLSRTTQTDEVIGSNTYTHKTVYDATTGGVNQTEYPGGFKLNYTYNTDGDLTKISRADNGKTIWEFKHIDDYGRMDEYYVGDAHLLVMKQTFRPDQTLQSSTVKKGNMYLKNNGYVFNIQTQNVEKITDNLNTAATQPITHYHYTDDKLDQIEKGAFGSNYGDVSNTVALKMQYDAKGNITDKSDVGKYFYYHPQPNALTYVTHRDPNCMAPPDQDDAQRDVNAISNHQQDITYNSFEQPVTICENGNTLTLKYGIDKQRIKTILTDASNNILYERIFVGDYEEETTSAGTRKIHYISSPSGTVAIYIETNGVGKMYFVLTDHLGSIIGLTDENGNIEQRYNYDAWGKRSLTIDNTGTGKYIFYRGYTGHEHLDEFALINMNGRLYDPTIGRMLSTDNYVQGGSQGFNRYSYVHNNPMKYTDPSGEYVVADDVAAALIGGTINLVSNIGSVHSLAHAAGFFAIGAAGGVASLYATPVAGGVIMGAGNAALTGYINNGKVDAGEVIKGGVVSGSLSVITAGLSNAIGPSVNNMLNKVTSSPVLLNALSQGLIGFGTGGIAGGLGNAMNGGNFWEGAWSGAKFGLATGLFTGAIGGYMDAVNKDRNPWNGKPNTVMEELPIKPFNINYDQSNELKLPQKLSHYSVEDPSNWTTIGLEQDGINYLTPNSELSSIGAKIELAMPNEPNFRIDINTTDPSFSNSNVMIVRRVTGNVYGTGGGGIEVLYRGAIDINRTNVTITRLR